MVIFFISLLLPGLIFDALMQVGLKESKGKEGDVNRGKGQGRGGRSLVGHSSFFSFCNS